MRSLKHNITIAEFIRHAVLKVLSSDIEKASQPKPWSPVSGYNLKNEPGAGYDQTKAQWTLEVITSYAEKVRVRQRKQWE